MEEIDYLPMIYELLEQIVTHLNFFVGCFQFAMVVFVLVILYKLLNLFF